MRRREFSPAQLLTLHIAALITAGGILLTLPVSVAPGHAASALNGFFTSTSAVCVTGLIVVDTPNYWSPFGQVVLMLLTGTGASCSSTTNSYACTVNYGWGGTITPSKTGYTFSPANISYSNVTSDQSSQNYTGSSTDYYCDSDGTDTRALQCQAAEHRLQAVSQRRAMIAMTAACP